MNRDVRTELALAAELREVCALLERRIGAGDKCDSESVLAAHPELSSNADAALEVIYTEFVAREQLGQRPEPADFYRRFPRFRDGLEQLFQIHGAAGGASIISAASPSLTPLPDGKRLKAFAEPAIDGSLRRIGNYEILGEIGRGGMGVVYKARQVGLNRLVALKMILTGADAGPAERARFRAEAESAARLRHSNIVQIYEVGEHEGRPFLSLELVEGGSLETRLNGTPLPAADSARLVEALARAMHHAHQQGVVHRDLKPANILLQKDEGGTTKDETESSFVAKITDFGLARRINADKPALTASGAIVGTPAYMAPEQAAGDAKETGPAADVYALGAILYELLTGRPPFQGVTILETLEQVRTQEPVPPSRLVPKLPSDIETICLKCLRKEPGRRYASAAELANDLGRYLRGDPIQARPIPAWEKGWKWARRRPTIAALLVALCSLAVISLVTVTLLWRRAENALDTVKVKQEETEAALGSKLVALAQRDWFVHDLEAARNHLGECPPERRGDEWRRLDLACRARVQVIKNPDAIGAVRSVEWSRDGRHIASAFSGGLVKVWDTTTWGQRFVDRPRSFRNSMVTFDPAGHLVSADSAPNLFGAKPEDRFPVDVRTFDLEGKRQTVRFTTSLPHGPTAFSGDGRRLLVGSWARLAFIDLSRPSPLPSLVDLPLAVTQIIPSTDARFVACWSLNNTIRVWDTTTQALAGPVIKDRGSPVMVFDSAADRLAVGGYLRGKNVRVISIFNFRAGQVLAEIRGFNSDIKCMTFSPDGRHLAVGSADQTVTIWNADTGSEVFTLRGHASAVLTLAFNIDGTRLATGCLDGTVTIWNLALSRNE